MYLDFRSAVESALSEALGALDLPADEVGIERPPEDIDAVLASNIAYRRAGDMGSPPPEVAVAIADEIDPGDYEYVGRVSTEGAYVNFEPDEDYFADTLAASQEENFGRLPDTGDSVVVEHTSANPTGPVHVGRARNPIVGDALARVLDYAGNDVETHYYVNDAGRQIAMFTWAYENIDESDLPEPERDSPEYEMVRYYRAGSSYLEEAGESERERAEAEIQSILIGLESGKDETYERVSEVVDRVLGGMRETLSRLPATFDEFIKETRFMRDDSTEDLIERLQQSEYSVYEDDAWQLDLPDFEKNLVFLRSDGTSLYTTRDLAHHEWKFEHFDRAVTVLGEDHKLQAQQLRATLEILGHDTDQLDQVFYSWVNLPDGGMSTREGSGVDLDDLLDESIDRARDEVEDRIDQRQRNDTLDSADIDRIAEDVGIGAVRYDIVSKQPTKGITFEWDRALDFEAQSGPYVQYVHARCCGILDEARDAGHPIPEAVDADPLTAPEERELLREIARFEGVIEQAAHELRPHVVATYTRDLAEAFNAFYRECPVLDADPKRRSARLSLVVGARTTMANALDILGVAAPDSM